ncbi:MAG: RraA family protein, partial [Pseudomonadota bacterium]
YKHMATAPSPAIAVVEDIDFPHCIGAFWGEVNATVHKSFGLSGALTNGVMRDLGDLPENFPLVAGSIGPSHGFVHVVEFATPVCIFGLNVNDGDLVHADRHGALVIPSERVGELEAAIARLTQNEKLVLDVARRGPMDFETFKAAWAAFEKART